MKVALVIAGTFSKLAGLEKHFLELSTGVAKEINLSIIAHKSYKSLFDQNRDIEFIELELDKSRYNLFVYLKLFTILKNKQFDIVHAQANKATYFISKIKNFFPTTKFIATIHNKKNKVSYFNSMDLVIGVSDFVSAQIKTKTVTIYNGIDTQKFKNTRPIDIRKEFNIQNNYPILLSIGRLVKAKGFDLLIQAAKDIDVNIVILGDGKGREQLERLIVENDLSSRIFIAGFRDSVAKFIKGSDGVVISSRNEGFSYAFAEALCSQRPLLSTDVADIKKFIPQELLIEHIDINSIKEKIKYFLENRDNIDLDKYYNFAINKLSIENMVDETLNVYRKVLGE